jgi:integrase
MFMVLNDKRLQSLRANPIPGRHADADGLFLRITAKGGFYWQWEVSSPRRTLVSYGTYPKVGLAEARQRHRDAQTQKRDGIDVNQAKKERKLTLKLASASNFEAVAREWLETRRGEWAPSHAEKIDARLKRDVYPWLGTLPVSSIDPPKILAVIRKIEARGVVETAHRALENISQVLRYAVASGRIQSDPARDLKGALKKATTKHMAAITDPEALGAALRAIDGYTGTYVVRAALQLTPLLLLRPGELRFGRWTEVDIESATWTIPPTRMKRTVQQKLSGQPHIVPLSTQAVCILQNLHQLTGQNVAGLMFPGERDHERAMSENTVNAGLRRLGYDTQIDVTGHGFRATARTLLDEQLHVDRAVIEAQLAHSVQDQLGRAYNRTTFLQARRTMMQRWSDYLDELRVSSVVRRKVA